MEAYDAFRPAGCCLELRAGEMETIVNVFGWLTHFDSDDRGVSSLKEESKVELRDYLII